MREIPLIAVLYLAYVGGRILASHDTGAAFDHAESVWGIERLLGLPSEHTVQQLALQWPPLVKAMGVYYAKVHFPATGAMLLWLFLRRPQVYPWFRWTLALLTGFGLVGHVLYPLAPPRMLTDHGMIDTATRYGQSVYGPVGTGLANQFAAMPSLHVAWAVLVAIAVIVTLRSRWRWLAVLHPVTTLAVVVVTGNHYWLDGIIGCLLLLAALAVTRPLRTSGETCGPAWPTRLVALFTPIRTVIGVHAWPFVRFAVVGSASTLLSSVIFLLLIGRLPSALANTVTAVVSMLAVNEAHRSWTFRSDRGGLTARVAAAGTVVLAYLITTGALLVLHTAVPDASAGLEVAVLLGASAAGWLIRYLLLGSQLVPTAAGAAQATQDPTALPVGAAAAVSTPADAEPTISSRRSGVVALGGERAGSGVGNDTPVGQGRRDPAVG